MYEAAIVVNLLHKGMKHFLIATGNARISRDSFSAGAFQDAPPSCVCSAAYSRLLPLVSYCLYSSGKSSDSGDKYCAQAIPISGPQCCSHWTNSISLINSSSNSKRALCHSMAVSVQAFKPFIPHTFNLAARALLVTRSGAVFAGGYFHKPQNRSHMSDR